MVVFQGWVPRELVGLYQGLIWEEEQAYRDFSQDYARMTGARSLPLEALVSNPGYQSCPIRTVVPGVLTILTRLVYMDGALLAPPGLRTIPAQCDNGMPRGGCCSVHVGVGGSGTRAAPWVTAMGAAIGADRIVVVKLMTPSIVRDPRDLDYVPCEERTPAPLSVMAHVTSYDAKGRLSWTDRVTGEGDLYSGRYSPDCVPELPAQWAQAWGSALRNALSTALDGRGGD